MKLYGIFRVWKEFVRRQVLKTGTPLGEVNRAVRRVVSEIGDEPVALYYVALVLIELAAREDAENLHKVAAFIAKEAGIEAEFSKPER